MSTSLRPLGPLLGAVARSAAALERLTPLIRVDPPWRRAWLDRLAVIETAGAASLHSGGPVLPDDVRDVDHAIATGPRARIIHGVRALWRVEAERRPLEVDLPLLLDALGRTVEVAPDRLVAARLTSGQGAAAAYIPNPVERAATLVAFAEDLEDLCRFLLRIFTEDFQRQTAALARPKATGTSAKSTGLSGLAFRNDLNCKVGQRHKVIHSACIFQPTAILACSFPAAPEPPRLGSPAGALCNAPA